MTIEEMASHTVQIQALKRYHTQICAVIRALERLQRYQAGDTSDLTLVPLDDTTPCWTVPKPQDVTYVQTLNPSHITWRGKIGARITFRKQNDV